MYEFEIQPEIAHIIPYFLLKNCQYHQLRFWNMLELFLETTTTNLIFTEVYSNIDRLDNLICLDIGFHSIFDHDTLLLNLSTFNNILHLISSIYIESYGLSVNYLESLIILEYMLSAKLLMVQEK